MKKLVFIFALILSLATWMGAQGAQNAPAQSKPQTSVPANEKVSTSETAQNGLPEAVQGVVDTSDIPDTICVDTKAGVVCLPSTDTAKLIELVKDVAAENKGNWPTSVLGWLTLLAGIAFSTRGTIALTAAKKVYLFLKVFLRSTLNIVAFIAGAVSAGATFLMGNGEFDWQIFTTLWGALAFLAVYVYEAKFKKKTPAKI